MKPHSILALLIGLSLLLSAEENQPSAAPAAAPAPRQELNLGRVMFIGDSLTHGVGAASYRWALHKIWADNGVGFEVIGITEGNRRPKQGIAPGTDYRGRIFNNRHCAMTSERAYEISGRKHVSQRLGASDIWDWLRLDADYQGEYRLPADEMPDTCFILAGTNDLLGDFDGKFHQPEILQTVTQNLLEAEKGDMSRIIDAIRQVNRQARIIVLAIPTWHDTPLNNTAEAHAAIAQYNQALAAWAASKGVQAIDINETLVDAACEEVPGKGVASFFTADRLHPSMQGDLLIGGIIAHKMGIPGRTAGLPRCAGSALRPIFTWSDQLPTGARWSTDHSCASLMLTPRVGNGATGGWETRRGLSLTLGSPAGDGKLTVTESYIIWGEDRILYSGDMSQNAKSLRIAWREADRRHGIPGGFYVWLGEMLIGEALPSKGAATCGLTLENNSSSSISIGAIAVSDRPTAPETAF